MHVSEPIISQPSEEDAYLFPASFAQQRLWFIQQLTPQSPAYNIVRAYTLHGPLNRAALTRSISSLIARHESLRTAFIFNDDDDPVQQVISPTLPFRFSTPTSEEWVSYSGVFLDLRHLPTAERKTAVSHHLHQEAHRPFNLSRLPLLRLLLIQHGEQTHTLLINIHHIIADGQSLNIFLSELSVLYRWHLGNENGDFPLLPLPLQYADFSEWQHQQWQDESTQSSLAYWREQFKSIPPACELPTDRKRPFTPTFHGARLPFQLNDRLVTQLNQLSQQHGVTLFVTLLSAFKTLLYRYTGQEDVLVGTPVAGRPHKEVEPILGFFINTLPLRSDLQGDPLFPELLKRVRETAVNAFAHQDMPLDKLIEKMQPSGQSNQASLFQIVFALQNDPPIELNLTQIETNPCPVELNSAKFDLTFSLSPSAQGLTGWFEYRSELFDAATIVRLAGHFQTLLKAIVSNPQQRLSQLPFITTNERQQLLIDWNETATNYPRKACIHHLFAAQAAQTPTATALIFADQQLTYQQLNERANQVAHKLQAWGVQPDSPVGLAMERSLEMVIAMLGILKAGAAYLPLDPTYPAERLAFMLQDTETAVILTQQQLKTSGWLPAVQKIVCLDSEWQLFSQQSRTNPQTATTAAHLAYVMYTSGSTGRPKGVSITHRNVVRLVKETNYHPFSATETFLQFAPISFDAATLELWGSLLNGAQLVIFPPHTPSLAELGRIIRQHQVTTLWLTARLFHLMVDEQLDDLKSVRHLLAGGDVLSVLHVRQVLNKLPNCQLINGYGPTENTTFTTCCPLKIINSEETVPIGRPIANTTVYILDKQLQPVPIGVPGELYIGGDGLARNYVNRPALTAERFIPNPFSSGSRLYKSGDLVRYRADGRIEFIGRIDNQVKIRGFRIELGEIEAILQQHPAIHEAVVLARQDKPNAYKQLVAYIRLHNEQSALSPSEWQAYLQSRLPAYMIPAHFVILDAFPLNPNGKINRNALPQPDAQATTGSDTAPRTPTEQTLATIWTELLNLEQISIHDSFFQLGGHSLLATQLASRLRRTFDVDLPLQQLFESPTIALLAVCVEEAQIGQQLPTLTPVDRQGNIPLSFAQERIWFLDRLIPETATYHIPHALRLTGQLDTAVLEQSLTALMTRHESLRTTVAVENGRPHQIIHPPVHNPLELHSFDLSQHPADQQEAEAARLIKAESQRPFSLQKGPLWRVSLFRLAENEAIFLLTIHHIIADGWSLSLFIDELIAQYSAIIAGESAALPNLPIQFADFAIQQREWWAEQALADQLAYWQQQLNGPLPILALTTDHPRPSVQTYRGARHHFILPAKLTEALKKVSQAEDATLFMTLLAAFNTLLHRYTGQTDLLVGSLIANRNRHEIENLIGCFMNNLVLRTSLEGNPTFRALLQRVRQVTLDAYANQDVPFEMLLAELNPNRDLSRTPFFQVMFALQNSPSPKGELPQITTRPYQLNHETAYFDLRLDMTETANSLHGSLAYNTDLFTAETMARFVCHFETLLAGIVQNPDAQLANLPLLSTAERKTAQIAAEQQHTFPINDCLHHRFAAQAKQTPTKTAVLFEDQQLTYAELNQRANQLAHALKARGVEPEMLVGLCVERSLEMIVGILGILKAGGAYLPLDPTLPPERRQFMLADAQAPILLTQNHLQAGMAGYSGTILCLDTEWETITADSPTSNPDTVGTPAQLAYVIYTSGSTGQPKGVLVNHANVARLFAATEANFHFSQDDVWTLFHSVAFDFSVWELWGALLYGGTLIVVPYWVSRSPDAFYNLLCQNKVTILNQTPSAFRQLMQTALLQTEEVTHKLRLIIFGGEALALSSLQPWYGRFGNNGTQLVNMYGITETTVHVTQRPLTQKDSAVRTSSVIGDPLADLVLYILDEQHQPVPLGVTGEMYVGGAGVARGYLNRPSLTAQRFIPNPFPSLQAGTRLYKTGDLARRLPDGNIEYLGRSDHQVKIRGFRIELGEIEAALNQHPAVWETAVLLRKDESSSQQLVAYVIPRDKMPTTHQLRQTLQQSLPDYMIPSHFVPLEKFPLTANGKLDRRALPAPTRQREDLETTYTPPRTPHEEMVAAIWSDVLQHHPIGIDDDFFALGGHSLLATQIIARIRHDFQIELPLRTLFTAPTVADLACYLENPPNQELDALPLTAVSTSTSPILSYAQQRLWFLDRLQPGETAYSIPIAVNLRGPLHRDGLEHSLRMIVNRHDVLRTTIATVDGQPSAQISPELTNWYTVTDLSHIPAGNRDAAAKQIIMTEAKRPFDLTTGPLIRGQLLCLAEESHILILNMHHIVTDGWSFDLLFHELSTFYQVAMQQQPAQLPWQLPNLPLQYPDYAQWQRQWLAGETVTQQATYWRRQLDNPPPLLALPTDYERPSEPSYDGATHHFTLPSTLLAALQQLSRETSTTLFMTILATFQLLLHRYSGQDDIIIGTPIANRRRPEIEGLIGFFINTLALRTNLGGNPTFRSLLLQVRETALEAYTHQDIPFEKLIDDLNIARQINVTPLFQVMLTLTKSRLSQLNLPNLDATILDIDAGTTRFDLELDLIETEAGLAGQLHYNTALFKAATIGRMASHFHTLLQSLVATPDENIETLPLLNTAELDQIIKSWNETAVPYPKHLTVIDLFETQARHNPTATAVAAADHSQTITYGELNQRANQLAHQLQALGAKPETKIALFLNRSVEIIIGMLGILKAGAAYVPIDPDYPAERISHILADTESPLLLTHSTLVSQLPPNKPQTICLDKVTPFSQANPLRTVQAENLAYAIYTSGSTGQPKGVMISHRSLTNFVTATTAYLDWRSEDVVLQFASMSFDTAVEEIFSTLTRGTKLILRTDAMLSSPAAFWQTCAAHKITILDLPTAYWHILCTDLPQTASEIPSTLRLVYIGGEKAAPEQLRAWRTYAPDAIRLLNGYGPTEITVVATACDLAGPLAAAAVANAPIGKPLANTQVYIVNTALQPVPIGVWGELYVAGAGLARGYLNQPGKTAERFIPNPFPPSGEDNRGGRLYKTGDLCRYLPDGTIEYRGRFDNQIKIRGFRVELSEIESRLASHPAVGDVVVTTQQSATNAQQLVAYYIAKSSLADQTLRHYLQNRLPIYMVPNHFVHLDVFPMTVSGKVDRQALPMPTMDTAVSNDSGPTTAIEQTLCDIWRDVLGLAQVSTQANFFSLGGDSILSIQIVSRAREAGVIITPRQLFQYQTVAELAAVAKPLSDMDTASKSQAIQSKVTGLAPLTPIQHWFFAQSLVEAHHYNQSVLLQLNEVVDINVLDQAIHAVIDQHDALRLCFEFDGTAWQQTHADHPVITPIVQVDLSSVSEGALENTIETAASHWQARLNLANGPIMRVVYFKLSTEQSDQLLIIIHHLVVDRISWQILLTDLERSYRQLHRSESVQLPPKTTAFKQWGEQLVTFSQSDELCQEQTYWAEQLRTTNGRSLPSDYPIMPEANTTSCARTLSVSLTQPETQALLQDVPPVYQTQINDVLLTALAQTLSEWTGERDLLLDLEGHGREEITPHIDLSRTVGWFTTLFPVRLRLEENADWGTRLKTIKEQLRQIPRHGLGYGVLRYLSKNAPVSQMAASAQISFNYLGQFDQTVDDTSLFTILPTGSGQTVSPHGQRSHLLELNGFVRYGRFTLNWTYSENSHFRSTIEQLAHQFITHLRALITHCQESQSGQHTPSDFPLAQLNQMQLDQVLAKFSQKDRVL